MYFDPDDPDAIYRQLGEHVADVPAEAPKPETTAFQDSLNVFVARAEADPDAALEYVRREAIAVRQAAVAANNMDSSTASKIEAWVGVIWMTTLQGVVASMFSVETDKAHAHRMAGEVAACLDRCAAALKTPVDVAMANKALSDAESCF